MAVAHFKSRSAPLAVLALIAGLGPARADGAASIAGVYRCVYGCRMTDVDPGIEINGDAADCMNELGGLFRGRLLAADSIACFNKLGALSNDRTTIRWTDGVVWKRLPAPSR
ncbi:MAG: hypothetical protein ABR970_17560 [Roseiarcus sp.]|jgi:hypothetical protein